MLVGVHAYPGLQQRRSDLVDQGDPTNLSEAQGKVALEHRIDRRQHGLDQVIEQMCESGGADNADQETLGLIGRRRGRGQRGGRSGHGVFLLSSGGTTG
ncbi:hypothetical protein D3C71_1764470 [compost metagenome]